MDILIITIIYFLIYTYYQILGIEYLIYLPKLFASLIKLVIVLNLGAIFCSYLCTHKIHQTTKDIFLIVLIFI